ncbi:hypothetical protein OAA27_01420 [bacterium]|nr:hypothetical protein [Rubripirellula sp.]MDB4331709.1 hypothetical protein [bacterium]MDB4338947.1 hypothetical protein [Rubripirellula sp.]
MMYLVLGALLGGLLIGFFVVVWKASPEWRWFNLVAVCITMLLAVVFPFPTAGVLKSRNAWHKVKEDLERRREEVVAEQRLIKYGDIENPQLGQGVVELGIELSKVGIEAGRRWRNLRVQQINNAQVILKKEPENVGGVAGIPANEPPVAPAAGPADPLVEVDMVVYGFGEVPDAQQQMLPSVYLGEYRVTASTPDSVTLSPTSSLEITQRYALQNLQNLVQNPSWTLYELLPLDAHDPFIAAGSTESDDEYLGRVDSDLVKDLFTKASDLIKNPQSPQNPALQTAIDSQKTYLEDGRRATDDDSPVSRWWKVEFIKSYDIAVDSPEQRGALDGGFFDGNGRAVDGRLQNGEAVRFSKGDELLMKEEAVNELVNDGIIEKRDRYYLRPLNDYRYILRRLRLRLDELAGRKTELEYEEQVLKKAVAKTEAMLVENQDIKLKLEQDRDQFRVEKNAIEDYTAEMRDQLDLMRTEMAQLHQHNLLLEKEIAEKHLAIERRVDGLSLAE